MVDVSGHLGQDYQPIHSLACGSTKRAGPFGLTGIGIQQNKLKKRSKFRVDGDRKLAPDCIHETSSPFFFCSTQQGLPYRCVSVGVTGRFFDKTEPTKPTYSVNRSKNSVNQIGFVGFENCNCYCSGFLNPGTQAKREGNLSGLPAISTRQKNGTVSVEFVCKRLNHSKQ
jgi:hypothetical protein